MVVVLLTVLPFGTRIHITGDIVFGVGPTILDRLDILTLQAVSNEPLS